MPEKTKHVLPARKHHPKFTEAELAEAFLKWNVASTEAPEKFLTGEQCAALTPEQFAEGNARALLGYLGK